MLTPEERDLFAATLSAVDRGACARWVKFQGVGPDDPKAYEAAKERWRSSPILHAPKLSNALRSVLAASAGPPVTDATPLHVTCWRGKFDVGDPNRCVRCGSLRETHSNTCSEFKGQEPGLQVDTTWGEFALWLVERAREVAEKGAGVVCCPTVSSDGRRVNESTTAMTAVNLDCDARGPWDSLLAHLDAIGIAYVAYQSGGWSPTAHKWHVLIPLSRHFDTSSPEKITLWKAAYNVCRVVFGVLADLQGEGFDPTIETPCTPVFVTERRKASDAPRQVVWRSGRALDLDVLVSSVPPPADIEAIRAGRAPRQSTEADPLSDRRVEEIIAALCVPVSRYMSDRRDLYLCLPGALLDRGVAADDVRTICEEVSFRCPGDPRNTRLDVAKKHKQHVHDCETTIARFERDGTYTRIGTLNGRWPDVARAIDVLFPDEELDEMRARLAAAAARARAAKAHGPFELPARHLEPVASQPPVSPVVQPETLRKSIKALSRRKLRSESPDDQILGTVLAALADREELTPRDDDGHLVRDGRGQLVDRDAAVSMAARSAAFKLPTGTLFEDVVDVFRPALHASLAEGETLERLMRYADREFTRAAASKLDEEQREAAERASAGSRMAAALDSISEENW